MPLDYAIRLLYGSRSDLYGTHSRKIWGRMIDIEYINWVRKQIIQYLDDVGSAERQEIVNHLRMCREVEKVSVPYLNGIVEPAFSLLDMLDQGIVRWGDPLRREDWSLTCSLEDALERAVYRPVFPTYGERQKRT